MRLDHTHISFTCWLAATLLASPLWAAFSGTDVFLPMVGRGVGMYSTQWYTTIWVYNPGDTAAAVSFYLLERNLNNLAAVPYTDTIQPGDTKCYENAVFTMFGKQVWGAVRVSSDVKVVVNERFYSQAAGKSEKDSFGQYFAGIPKSFALGSGEKTQLLGVYQTQPSSSSEFRYNYGFVEVTGNAVTVRATPVDETGAALATAKDHQVLAYSQRQFAFKDVFPSVSTENARLTLEVVSGSGKVITYGAGISNAAQDPTTYEMQFKDELLSGGSGEGLTTVSHDGSLTGDGTSSSPLGIADGGVTPEMLSSSDATSGQVLTYTGTTVAWQSGGELSLPYSGSASTSATDAALEVTNSGSGPGVEGISDSGNYHGYLGYTDGGVVGQYSPSGNYGYLGRANAGVYAYAYSGRGVEGGSGDAAGVYGTSSAADGVVGISSTTEKSGVSGSNSSSGGYGVSGRNTSSGHYGYLGGSYGAYGRASGTATGVYGIVVESDSGVGTVGLHNRTGNYGELGAGSYGAHAVAFSSGATGLYAQSSSGDGVSGSAGTTAKSGVYGRNSSSGGYGVFGRNTSTGNSGYLGGAYGVYGEVGSGQSWAAAFKGNVKVLSATSGNSVLELGEGLDYAEGFDVADAEEIATGAVLVIDPGHPGRLTVSRAAYDRRVAGIVAGAGGLASGVTLGAGSYRYQVALAGRVYCSVDASYGEVSPGDLLTTSPTPGHAMAVKDHDRARGAVLGKAMEGLAGGRRGQILVLVSLQ